MATAPATPSYASLPGIANPTDSVFQKQFLSTLPQFLGGKTYSDDQISQAIQNSSWYGKLGSGSDPYNAAYEVGLKLGSTPLLGTPGSVYDPSAEAQSNQGAVDRSPEGIARAQDSGGLFGGDFGGLLGLGLAGAGLYFGLPALGEAAGFGAAAGGVSEGAAFGMGLGAGSSELAAMEGAVGLGGGVDTAIATSGVASEGGDVPAFLRQQAPTDMFGAPTGSAVGQGFNTVTPGMIESASASIAGLPADGSVPAGAGAGGADATIIPALDPGAAVSTFQQGGSVDGAISTSGVGAGPQVNAFGEAPGDPEGFGLGGGGGVDPTELSLEDWQQAIEAGGGLKDASLGSDVTNFLKSNWKTLLPVGIAGANALRPTPKLPNVGNLNDIAGSLASQGVANASNIQTLENPLLTGNLPGPQAAQLEQAKEGIRANIRSKYANLNLSGSTMEQQELSGVDLQSEALKGNMEQQLFQEGLNLAGVSGNEQTSASSLYTQLAQLALTQDEQLRAGITNVASALAMGSALGNRG